MENMNMTELRSLARERNVRGFSRLRKTDLINLLRTYIHVSPNANLGVTTDNQRDNQTEPKPLTKRQIKCRRNKASTLSKNLRSEIDDLKSQMDNIEDKIAKASNSTSSRFKQKKIRSMKREATKIAEKLREHESTLESLEAKAPLVKPVLKPNKRIKNKIVDLNRKIRRAKGRMKHNLIAKRDALRSQLESQLVDPTPRLTEGAFGGAYSRYRIDGVEGMDLDTYFSKTRGTIFELLHRESTRITVRSQTTTWIRFIKDGIEHIDLAFNSRMTPVYNVNDIGEVVGSMIMHISQVENPALRDSKFVFDRVMRMELSMHRLNLTRGSSYIPLLSWLSPKEAIINPKNLDMKCFKWAVIAALKWKEIGRDQQRVSKLRRYDDLDWDGINFPVSACDI